jgi:hypothetical protein
MNIICIYKIKGNLARDLGGLRGCGILRISNYVDNGLTEGGEVASLKQSLRFYLFTP